MLELYSNFASEIENEIIYDSANIIEIKIKNK